ncbi:Endoribonuclease YbeY [Rhodobacteraceae bacterium THAF1]|uniref:rRNA maturation RNase YbeY n=1 Tax=Palleronia sp. THAF1 TaxID=2587842 RepID=UPI000F3BE903|nr:rRNA maturation RNase YbeY [Palleronia sp. THAF1]QFU09470.1 Endoribonuclease YbeY [Palleronia sp. THAF1]VDC21851.1 Endoribonuclease YbeY [Rhodobacteraceae bacterium THAF1]
MSEIDVLIEDAAWNVLDLEALCVRAVNATLAYRGVADAEVAILACNDARIATLNADFRGKPRPTNVLSWPSEERGAEKDGGIPDTPDDLELGDIAIAYGVTASEADAAGISMADHTTHLIVHATLHLLGFDHERDGDAALMEGLEVEILGKLGLPDPYNR